MASAISTAGLSVWLYGLEIFGSVCWLRMKCAASLAYLGSPVASAKRQSAYSMPGCPFGQERFGGGRGRVVGMLPHEGADLLGKRRAARLARLHHLHAALAQRGGEKFRVGGFPAALRALERYELAAHWSGSLKV